MQRESQPAQRISPVAPILAKAQLIALLRLGKRSSRILDPDL